MKQRLLDEPRHCAQCGAVLSVYALEGVCGNCLLKPGLAPLPEPFDEPAEETRFPALRAGSKRSTHTEVIGRFGDYELLEEIARGGMGIVYRARQVSLDRIVAVKMLLAGPLATKDFVQRFRTESAAAASLQHPNIVAIHEVGFAQGQHYFAMDFVEGLTLAQLVAKGPLPARQAATYLKTIAGAIHFAHERNVLHRDLKPSNVLIDSATDQPRVTDFGLAKRLEAETELTLSGQMLGSPNYMSPEQATAKRGTVGRRSDVYSLGAILYHLLTGRPPFQGETLTDVLHQLADDDPLAPRLLTPRVPHDLETICLKCLEKEPAKRYQTAEELADELDRFLRDEPIHAHPVTRVGRTWRWCRRKPALASLVSAVAILIIAGALGSTMAAFRIARESQRARKAELEAIEKKQDATDKLWGSYFAQAQANRWSGRAGRRFDSLDVLAKAAAIRPSLELRNEAIACLALADIRIVKAARDFQKPLVLDGTLERYAIGDELGNVSIRRVADDEELSRFSGSKSAVALVFQFSPDGQMLAVHYADGWTRIWHLARREVILEMPTDGHFKSVDFSPDNRQLAALSDSRQLTVFDLSTAHKLRSFSSPSLEPTSVCFSPDGQRLAVVCETQGQVVILDAESGTVLSRLKRSSGKVSWHPDGRHLATALDWLVTVWDTETGEEKRRLQGHQATVLQTTFNRAGGIIASSSWDGKIRLWDSKSGQQLVSASGGGGYRFQFSQDDSRLCSWSGHQFALYEVVAGAELRTLPEALALESKQKDGTLAFSPDGKLLAYAIGDQLKFEHVPTRREIASLTVGDVQTIVFDATGENVVVCSPEALHRWPIKSSGSGPLTLGSPVLIGPLEHGGIDGGRAALSANGKVFGAVHRDRCFIYDTKTWTERGRTALQPGMKYITISPDGHWIATGGWHYDGVKIWNAETGLLDRELPAGDTSQVAFDPLGRWLITGNPTEYRYWETSSWKAKLTINRSIPGLPGAMAFSKDGRMLAATQSQGLIRLLDAATGQELASVEAPNAWPIAALRFNADGTQLAVMADVMQIIHIWDLRLIRQQLAKIGLDWDQPPFPPAADKTESKFAGATVLGGNPALASEQRRRLELALHIPARDPKAKPELLDLSAFYNASLVESWLGGRFADADLGTCPCGLQTLGGVQFDVRGVVQLAWDSNDPTVKGRFPRQITAVPVRRKCERLHFLHAASEQVPEATEVGEYVIHYANKDRWTVSIIYGRDLRFWWYEVHKPAQATAAHIVWTGTNDATRKRGVNMRLFHSHWNNPLPDVEIESIDFVSSLALSAPFLVAITAEP